MVFLPTYLCKQGDFSFSVNGSWTPFMICHIVPSFPRDLMQTSCGFCSNMQGHRRKEKMYLDRRVSSNVGPLPSNQKLLHSKELHDAFGVLSSRRHLFPACPEESNPRDYFHKLERSAPPRHAKCITLLKPPGKLDGRTEKRRNNYVPAHGGGYWTRNQDSCVSGLISQKAEDLSHPTRIVVLKPGPGKQTAKTKAPVTSVGSLGHLPEEIAQRRPGNFGQRNEAFLSPMLSNGYAAETSTVYVSGDEYTDDEFFDPSELDYATPRYTGFHDSSRKASPGESPVLREAKRRLLKRFERLTSNGRNHVVQETPMSAGTLGEMLAFHEMGKEGTGHNVASEPMISSCYWESKLKNSISNSFNDVSGCENRRLTILNRSNSAPSSWPTHGNGGLELEFPEMDGAEAASAKAKMKSLKSFPLEKKSVKSSFKGKVSNFFFSHGRKFGLEKPSIMLPSKGSNIRPQRGCDLSCGASSTSGHESCDSMNNMRKLRGPFPKVPFEDELACDALKSFKSGCQNHFSGGISRSSPIKSVSRNLPMEKSHLSRERSNHLRYLGDLLKADIEEHERISFIKPLLSSIGIDGKASVSFPCKWHSLESPLDPALLEIIFESKEELVESREKRSSRRLLFDWVNALLLESACAPPASSIPLTEEVVLHRLRELFSSEWKLLLGSAETSSQMVDRILRKDIGGKEWAESAGLETTELGSEIERQISDQLLEEALDDFLTFCL